MVSSYLDVEIRNDQYRPFNTTPLDCIAGYIMEDDIGDMDLERLPQRRLPQRRLNLTDGSISSYCSILNSPKRLRMIKQAKKLAAVLCDINSDCLG